MKAKALTILTCLFLFFSCNNKEKEIIIENIANPKYDIGIWFEDEKNTSYKYIDVYSLWEGEIGKTRRDSVKHTILKAFIVSKDSIVLSEFLERSYLDNVPHLTVFGNEINLKPYLRGITCEYIRFPKPYSYNDLIFYTLDVVGKDGKDNKYYNQPLTLMINLETKECTVIGRAFYIDGPNGQNMAIYDGKYFGILDFYMDSREYICKYYDTKGNYVGWSPSVNLVYTKTGEKFIYYNPLKNINTDWKFTYGNDKYGRPVSMKNSKEKYEIKYTSKGYHITGYDDKDRKKYDFEPNDINEFIDLRTWNREFKNRGKLIKYYYDWQGKLDYKKYYNASQSYYLRESQNYNGEFSCDGIYRNAGEFSDDVLINVSSVSDMWTRTYPIYRIDPQSGIKSKIASLPKQDIKQYLLNYLYNLE